MRTSLRIAAVALAAATGLLPAAGPAMADPVSVNDRVSKSLVYLETTVSGFVQVPFTSGAKWVDVAYRSNCSGFVVDKAGFIATAGHCVEASADDMRRNVLQKLAKSQGQSAEWVSRLLKQAIDQGWQVRDGSGAGTGKPSVAVKVIQPAGPSQVIRDAATVQVVAFQPFMDGDNAVLKLATVPGELHPLPISNVAPKAGEAITSVGWPGQVSYLADKTSLPAPSFKTGTVSSRQTAPNGVTNTEVSSTIGKGMSGGPTINAAGQVVGINSFKPSSAVQGAVGETSEFYFITDNLALRRFLESNGVTLASVEEESSGLNMWVWLGPLIAIAVLLLGGGLLLALRGKKKTPAPAYAGAPGGAPGYGPGPNQGSYNPPQQGGPQSGPTNTPPFGGPPQGPPPGNNSPFMPPPPR